VVDARVWVWQISDVKLGLNANDDDTFQNVLTCSDDDARSLFDPFACHDSPRGQACLHLHLHDVERLHLQQSEAHTQELCWMFACDGQQLERPRQLRRHDQVHRGLPAIAQPGPTSTPTVR
jgi:hypothetical protein